MDAYNLNKHPTKTCLEKNMHSVFEVLSRPLLFLDTRYVEQYRPAVILSQIVYHLHLQWLLWVFPRVQGFWDIVRRFIPRLRFFFFF